MLKIYTEQDEEKEVNEDNPIMDAFDALNGSWSIMPLYLKNTDPLLYYENVKLNIVDQNGNLIQQGLQSNNIYQLMKGVEPPTYEEWNKGTPPFVTLDMGSIGDSQNPDIETFHPFWLRIFVHGQNTIGLDSEVSLEIEAIERLI